ncbi:MAG TPA: hypothetical protein DCZ94_02895 [Lentisphaeria bacterium]|nr:MAG: hypothetical protein A2X48_03540 [Lentisphaerae bacterium GWF2_49_21]HBC85881.1 hypothetical protein [Lentisphaeria bacterium]
MRLIILIVVDVLIVIGIIAIIMSIRRRKDNASTNLHLRNPSPGGWNWRLASGKQKPSEDVVNELGDKESVPEPDPKQEGMAVQTCSLCGAPMVLRAAQKGKYAGKPYFGCSKYPKCENTSQYISLRDTKIMKSILR